MFDQRISRELIDESNSRLAKAHAEDLDALAAHLDRRGLDIERIIRQAMKFSVALPSWGFTQGGTRFGRFPAKHEPATLEQKLFAASFVNDLTAVTPRVSLHIPWDIPEKVAATRRLARKLGLSFDAMNSNTFQDQPASSIPTSSVRWVTPIPPSAARPSSTTSAASNSARPSAARRSSSGSLTVRTSPASRVSAARSTAPSIPSRTSMKSCRTAGVS